MDWQEIVRFLKERIPPLTASTGCGLAYRCAVTLKDGLYLPCVSFRPRQNWIDLAIRRFDETRPNPAIAAMLFGRNQAARKEYRMIVESFVCGGNRINEHDVAQLSLSRHVIVPMQVAQIGGETSMGWTQFNAEMSDGKMFQFGTTFHVEFFEMPDGYSGSDVSYVVPADRGSYPEPGSAIYREKPFFECYIDGI